MMVEWLGENVFFCDSICIYFSYCPFEILVIYFAVAFFILMCGNEEIYAEMERLNKKVILY